jgi:hypothetical protein
MGTGTIEVAMKASLGTLVAVLLVITGCAGGERIAPECLSVVGADRQVVIAAQDQLLSLETLPSEDREIWTEGMGRLCPGAVRIHTDDGRQWLIFATYGQSENFGPVQALFALEAGHSAPVPIYNGVKPVRSPHALYAITPDLRGPDDGDALFAVAQFESHRVNFSYRDGQFIGTDPED